MLQAVCADALVGLELVLCHLHHPAAAAHELTVLATCYTRSACFMLCHCAGNRQLRRNMLSCCWHCHAFCSASMACLRMCGVLPVRMNVIVLQQGSDKSPAGPATGHGACGMFRMGCACTWYNTAGFLACMLCVHICHTACSFEVQQ